MIIHTVLLDPKPEATQDEITTALEHVRDLQQVIPGILDVQAGENEQRIAQALPLERQRHRCQIALAGGGDLHCCGTVCAIRA